MSTTDLNKKVDAATKGSIIISVRVPINQLATIHAFLSDTDAGSISNRGSVCRTGLELLYTMILNKGYTAMSLSEAVKYCNAHLPLQGKIRKSIIEAIAAENADLLLTLAKENDVAIPDEVASRIANLTNKEE